MEWSSNFSQVDLECLSECGTNATGCDVEHEHEDPLRKLVLESLIKRRLILYCTFHFKVIEIRDLDKDCIVCQILND